MVYCAHDKASLLKLYLLAVVVLLACSFFERTYHDFNFSSAATGYSLLTNAEQATEALLVLKAQPTQVYQDARIATSFQLAQQVFNINFLLFFRIFSSDTGQKVKKVNPSPGLLTRLFPIIIQPKAP